MFTSVRVPSGFLVANHQYSNESKCLKWPLKYYLSGTKNINSNDDNSNNDDDNNNDSDETTITSQNTREQGFEKK